MKHESFTCDIKGDHGGTIKNRMVPVMFDHDQEDGKSKMTPYFELHKLDVCEKHFVDMTINKKLIYAYGAMGYYDYTL